MIQPSNVDLAKEIYQKGNSLPDKEKSRASPYELQSRNKILRSSRKVKRQKDEIAPRSVEFFEPNMIQADTPSGASTGEYDEQPHIT